MDRARRARRTGLVLVVVAALLVVVGPRARDAWITWRTGVAPGSMQPIRLTVAGGTLVAVGIVPVGSSVESAAWRIADGRWTEIGDRSVDRLLTDVVAKDGELFASGSMRGAPAVFHLEEGGDAWTTVWTAGAGESGELSAITSAGGGELVGVGWQLDGDQQRGLIVTKPAAGTGGWTKTAAEERSVLTSVAATEESVLAGGQIASADGRRGTGTVWRRDAGAWTPTSIPDPPDAHSRRTFVARVGEFDDRVVAVGQRDSTPTAWVSDGAAWREIALPGDGAGRRVTGLAASRSAGLVVTGSQVGRGDVQSPIAWRSVDALDWELVGVSGSDYAGLADVVAVGEQVIALGTSDDQKRVVPDVYELRGSILAPITVSELP